jgi:galactokinase/mevalonate kinase-like predicted kinase
MIPFRIEMTGAYMECCIVNRYHEGATIAMQIEADQEFHRKSGLASSTQYTASVMYGEKFPDNIEPMELACKLYMGEKRFLIHASTSDACSIALQGCSYIHYSINGNWPDRIERIMDQASLRFMQENIQLYFTHERKKDHDLFAGSRCFYQGVRDIARSSEMCWEAIKNKDAQLLGQAFNLSYHAHRTMFPTYETDEMKEVRDRLLPSSYGCSVSGGGGGGYLIFCSPTPIEGAIRITPTGLKK